MNREFNTVLGAGVMVLLGLVFGLTGCVASTPRVLKYEDYSIVIADAYSVNKFCGAGNGRWDNGLPRAWDENVCGCWDANVREIWVRQDSPECLTHELAHKAGVGDPEEEGYDW